jgi:hypothetical protein
MQCDPCIKISPCAESQSFFEEDGIESSREKIIT